MRPFVILLDCFLVHLCQASFLTQEALVDLPSRGFSAKRDQLEQRPIENTQLPRIKEEQNANKSLIHSSDLFKRKESSYPLILSIPKSFGSLPIIYQKTDENGHNSTWLIPTTLFPFSILQKGLFWQGQNNPRDLNHNLRISDPFRITTGLTTLNHPPSRPCFISIQYSSSLSYSSEDSAVFSISLVENRQNEKAASIRIIDIEKGCSFTLSLNDSDDLEDPPIMLGAFSFQDDVFIFYREKKDKICLIVLQVTRDTDGFTVINGKTCIQFENFVIESLPPTVCIPLMDSNKSITCISAAYPANSSASDQEANFKEKQFMGYSFSLFSQKLTSFANFSLETFQNYSEKALISFTQGPALRSFWILGLANIYRVLLTTKDHYKLFHLPLVNISTPPKSNFQPLLIYSTGSFSQAMEDALNEEVFFNVSGLKNSQCIVMNETKMEDGSMGTNYEDSCGSVFSDSSIRVMTIIGQTGFMVPFNVSWMSQSTKKQSIKLNLFPLALPGSFHFNQNKALSFARSNDSLITTAYQENSDGSYSDYIISFSLRPFYYKKHGLLSDSNYFNCLEVDSISQSQYHHNCIRFESAPLIIPVPHKETPDNQRSSFNWRNGFFFPKSSGGLLFASNISTQDQITSYSIVSVDFSKNLELFDPDGPIGLTTGFFDPFSQEVQVNGTLSSTGVIQIVNSTPPFSQNTSKEPANYLPLKSNCSEQKSEICDIKIFLENVYPLQVSFVEEITVDLKSPLKPQVSELFYSYQISEFSLPIKNRFYTKEIPLNGTGFLLIHIYLNDHQQSIQGFLVHYGVMSKFSVGFSTNSSFESFSNEIDFLLFICSDSGKLLDSQKLEFTLVFAQRGSNIIRLLSFARALDGLGEANDDGSVYFSDNDIQYSEKEQPFQIGKLFSTPLVGFYYFLVEDIDNSFISLFKFNGNYTDFEIANYQIQVPFLTEKMSRVSVFIDKKEKTQNEAFILTQKGQTRGKITVLGYNLVQGTTMVQMDINKVKSVYENGKIRRFSDDVVDFSVEKFTCYDHTVLNESNVPNICSNFEYIAVFFFNDRVDTIPFNVSGGHQPIFYDVFSRSHNVFEGSGLNHSLVSVAKDWDQAVLHVQDKGPKGFLSNYILFLSYDFILLNSSQIINSSSLCFLVQKGSQNQCLFLKKGMLASNLPHFYFSNLSALGIETYTVSTPSRTNVTTLFITEYSGFDSLAIYVQDDVHEIEVSFQELIQQNRNSCDFKMVVVNDSAGFFGFSQEKGSLSLIKNQQGSLFNLKMTILMFGGIVFLTLLLIFLLALILKGGEIGNKTGNDHIPVEKSFLRTPDNFNLLNSSTSREITADDKQFGLSSNDFPK